MKLPRINLFIALTIAVLGLSAAQTVYATFSTDQDKPMVSITFDDGFASTYTKAQPILTAANLTATVYVTTNFIGSSSEYMSWTQVQALQNTYDWEIGNHTVSHPELPLITKNEINTELVNSQAALQSHNITSTSFASPFGAYDNKTLIEVAKYFSNHRGFHDRDSLNKWPYDTLTLQVQSSEAGVTLATVESWIQRAKTEKKWLVLVFHEVADQMDPNYDYTTTTSDFQSIVNYIKTSGVTVVKPNITLTPAGVNILSNSGFTSGLDSNWTTDQPTFITLDNAGNGRYPDYQNSLKFGNAPTSEAHLFSKTVLINSSDDYLVNAYVNADKLTSGSINFYVDEYDATGTWISGKVVGSVVAGLVQDFRAVYTPTSVNVKSIRLQTSITSGAAGTAYVDQIAIRGAAIVTPTPTGSVTPTPTSTPTPTATPSPTITPTPVMGLHIASGQQDGTSLPIQTPFIETNGQTVNSIVYGLTCTATGYEDSLTDNSSTNGWSVNFIVRSIPAGTDCHIKATAKKANGNVIVTSNEISVVIQRNEPVLILPQTNGTYTKNVAAVVDAPGAVSVELYMTPIGQTYRGYKDVYGQDGWAFTWSLDDLSAETTFIVDAWAQYPNGERKHTNVMENLTYNPSSSTSTPTYPHPRISIPNNVTAFDSTVNASVYAPGAVAVEFYLTPQGQAYRGLRDENNTDGWQASWVVSDLPEGTKFMLDSWVVYPDGSRVQAGVIQNLMIDRTKPSSGSITVAQTNAVGLLKASVTASDAQSGITKVQFMLLPQAGYRWISSWDYDSTDGWNGQWILSDVPASCSALIIAYIYDGAGNAIQTGGVGNLCIQP
ncbi:polysaccharide deacetylase family protein [candidate division WWE3 bacterium]|nr:polysaccharide deacetylase family protein [candidate division WWE3 bacterium]